MERKFDAYHEKELVYKCSLEELHAKSKILGFRDDYVLAYIRQVGARNVRFYLDANMHHHGERPIDKKLYRLCDEKDSGNYDFNDNSYNPMIEDTFHENSWYGAYKLGIIPIDSEDSGRGIKTFYVGDFCNLLQDGIIEIWEMEE